MSEKASNDPPRPSCNFQNLARHFQYFVGRAFKRLRKNSNFCQSRHTACRGISPSVDFRTQRDFVRNDKIAYFFRSGFKPMTCSKLSRKTGFEDLGWTS